MVREIKSRGLTGKLIGLGKNPFFIPILFLLFLVVTVPVVTVITQKQTDFEQRAASAEITETINIVMKKNGTTAMNNGQRGTGASEQNDASYSGPNDISFPTLVVGAVSAVTIISLLVLGYAFLKKKDS